MFQRLANILHSFAHSKSGATAIEYGLIAGLIFLAIVTSLNDYGNNMDVMYNKITVAIDNAIN